MIPLKNMQGEHWLGIAGIIRTQAERFLSEETAADLSAACLPHIHAYLTTGALHVVRAQRPAYEPPPEYDPDEVIEGGVVFSDIATKTYVDIDGNKVCSKMDRLQDGDLWDSVKPRLRARYTSDFSNKEPGWTYVEPPETVKGRWEDDGGAPGAVGGGTPPEDPVRDELVARDAQGNYLGTVERDVTESYKGYKGGENLP